MCSQVNGIPYAALFQPEFTVALIGQQVGQRFPANPFSLGIKVDEGKAANVVDCGVMAFMPQKV